jgi:GDP-D-mannose dehydratase
MYSYSASEQSINEDTEFSPQNFYGETKVIALELIREYRSTSKVNASGLILFNHASEYNNKKFLFPIIAQQLSLILQGATNQLSLRNPLASIEMTSAREIVDAIMLISELGESGDFVLAQGVSYKIERIIQEVCKILNLPGIDIESINPPIIEPCLVGDITKAKKVLNWAPSQKPWEVLKDMTIKTSNINP